MTPLSWPLSLAAALCVASAADGAVIRSAHSGPWSAPETWESGTVPGEGDGVVIRAGHHVIYDVDSKATLRAVNIAGGLMFSRERNTRMNVGLLKVQPGEDYSEEGFACDAHLPEPNGGQAMPFLEVGTAAEPIPAGVVASIRLVFSEGMDRESCPALVACMGRMELHGAPMNRTWLKLNDTAPKGATELTLAEAPAGWRSGDHLLVTGTGDPEESAQELQTEERTLSVVEGTQVRLDRPLEFAHRGQGEYRGEVANLSRNVIIESADPAGVRGHTMYHRQSAGSISYAEFRHLGKQGVLGRYSIHFHLAGDTMRGGSVIGASIWDSANRWITIHGTAFLVVRDCVGYRSIGHGFFLEDGTEVYNVLDRNLGVQAQRGRKLPNQALPFDHNEGAAFWWANSLNTFTRNVTVENAQYGYRYEATPSRSTPLLMRVLQPDGSRREVDIRSLPFVRFEDNESHSEAGLYAFNLGEGVNRVGPDDKHPFVVRRFKAWNVHYAFRPQAPSLLVEGLHIHQAAYGVYHPNFDRHVYRDVLISHTDAEPFNRGHDDDSIQYGVVTVDGIRFDDIYGATMPLIQMTEDNPTGLASTHFRNLKVSHWRGQRRERSIVNRGGGPRPEPRTPTGVPVFVHGWFGPGRDAKVESTAAKDFGADGLSYRSEPDLTGDESRVAEVTDVSWPELLHPVDDLPPCTVITRVQRRDGRVWVQGTTSDNGGVKQVLVNGRPAELAADGSGQWEITLDRLSDAVLEAKGMDVAGNIEQNPHRIRL